MTTEGDHYFGLGFGKNFMGSGNDMIMCANNSGSLACTDMYSNGYSALLADSTGDLTVSSSVYDNLNIYEIRRALDTGDTSDDYVFALDTEFDMIWALFIVSNNIGVSHDYRVTNKACFSSTFNKVYWLTLVTSLNDVMRTEHL